MVSTSSRNLSSWERSPEELLVCSKGNVHDLGVPRIITINIIILLLSVTVISQTTSMFLSPELGALHMIYQEFQASSFKTIFLDASALDNFSHDMGAEHVRLSSCSAPTCNFKGTVVHLFILHHRRVRSFSISISYMGPKTFPLSLLARHTVN